MIKKNKQKKNQIISQEDNDQEKQITTKYEIRLLIVEYNDLEKQVITKRDNKLSMKEENH